MTTYLIREMPEGDRPRERLKARGAAALGDAELIAILLRTGVQGQSAVQLAQQLLKEFRTLDELARVPLETLAKVKGVGETKAIQLKAAFELARALEPHDHTKSSQSSIRRKNAASLLREEVRLLDRELFRVLLLNTKNGLIKNMRSLPRLAQREHCRAARSVQRRDRRVGGGVILAHNHPSGDPTPSSEDISITKRLVKAGELLNIAVLDHIILGQRTQGREQDFVSMKELGLM